MKTDLRSLTMPFLFLAGFNILPGIYLRPFWWVVLCFVLLAYRGWLDFSGRAGPPRWMSYAGVFFAGLVVWQHYTTFMGDEAASALLGLLVCIKTYELRSKRDYFIGVMMCVLAIMSYALSEQGLLLTVFLLVDVALLILFLMVLEEGRWSVKKGLLPSLRPVFLLALKALPLMALIFVLFPRFSTGFGTGQSASGKIGMSDQLRPGSVGRLIGSDELVFRATFLHGDMPPRQSLYWRGAVLDQSEGLNWSRLPVQDATPLTPAQPELEGDVEIYLEPDFDRYIYALDNTESAFFPRDNRLHFRQGRVYEMDQPLHVRERYFLRNALSWPKENENRENFIATPEEASQELKEFVKQKRKGTAAASVSEVLKHFQQNGYAYSLSPPPVQTVDDFLFKTKVGFCEHYAGATATVLRMMGYPSRVVVGFQGGTPSLLDNYITVRASDAHAWVEYYDAESGRWRRADPTAQVDPLRIREGSDRYREIRPSWAQGWVPNKWFRTYSRVRSLFDEVDAVWSGFLLHFDLARQRDLLARLGMEGALFRALPVFLFLGVLLLLAIMHFFEAQRREPLSPEQKLYVQLLQLGRRWKLAKMPNEGPLAWLSRIEATQPHLAEAIGPIMTDLIDIRYGTRPLTPELQGQLKRRLKALKKLSIIRRLR